MENFTSALPDRLAIPNDFSAQDKSFVYKTLIAIEEGRQLERWSRDPNRRIQTFPLDLNRPYRLENRAWGYFADVSIAGKVRTALGVLQQVEFGKLSGPNPEALLKDYVLNEFLKSANWAYENGDQGGFTFRQLLYRTRDGAIGKFGDDRASQITEYRDIGTKYLWTLATIYLHDFVFEFGPVKAGVNEAVSVVLHPDFVHIVPNPKPGYKLEVAFGYPFLDYTPVPNYLGWGPGRFDWAIKTYSFLLRDNNEVRCDMDFIAGARARKVLDFGKYVPDPFYGSAAALKYLTLGIYDPQPFHDFWDGQMAAQHARVHQALMEGAAKVMAAWQKNPDAVRP